jgi:hypothetical protein
MICEVFVASLPSHLEVRTSIEMQMVTIWPIETDHDADRLEVASQDSTELCRHAVNSYGLATALAAINDARRSHAVLDGLGPYLLAWSPPSTKGQANALVLVSDLSNVTNSAQAKRIFSDWSQDIVENPALWERGWNVEKMRVTIRLWADKYGSDILKAFGAGG